MRKRNDSLRLKRWLTTLLAFASIWNDCGEAPISRAEMISPCLRPEISSRPITETLMPSFVTPGRKPELRIWLNATQHITSSSSS